uniref:STAS domain-containing protein n=1 Tax=Biomphalaria glabrata TaxID=6526 RepID=A0A2C9JY32_BIOGL
MVTETSNLLHYLRLSEFESKYRVKTQAQPVLKQLQASINKRIARFNIKESLLSFFPFITTLRKYKLKEDLPNDVIAGFTAGIMMIPQGMAFAALSTLPPIVGLYISFFASLTYFWFGTGRQLSWGCVAVLSLMIAGVLDKYDNKVNEGKILNSLDTAARPSFLFNFTNTSEFSNQNMSLMPENITERSSMSEKDLRRIEVASGVTLIAGLLLIFMSMIGLSRITNLMSNSLITGFTVGISFHVATSQLKGILGIKIPRHTGIMSIVYTWIGVLRNVPNTNIATLLTSVISIAILYLVKTCVNERFRHRLRVPIPIELLVIIIGTLIAKFVNFHKDFKVDVVKEIPIGLPPPKIPDLELATDYIGDGLVIIIIAYAQTLAMAKTMGLKHNYVINANQEMFASGACAVVCGIFSGYICGASVSRSVVQDGAGGRTQVASLFAAGLVLLVIMVLAPFFYHLPMCILSSIILVNLLSMFQKILEIPKEWRKSRYDCAVWVCACVATIILNADFGLLAGILFSIFLVALRGMLTPIIETGQIHASAGNVELRSVNRYSDIAPLKDVRIFKIKTPLYFVNADIFTSKIFSKTGINPIKMKKQSQTYIVKNNDSGKLDQAIALDVANTEHLLEKNPLACLKVLILHTAEVSFIDLMGVQALQFVITELSLVGVEVLITDVPESILPMLKSTGFLDKNSDRLYLSVDAALASTITQLNSRTDVLSSGDSVL